MEEGHHGVDADSQITPEAGRPEESAVRREALQLSDAELAALGYVKAGTLQRGGSQTMEFSGGLLPDSAQAGTYEDASRERVVTVFGHKFSAGLLFVKGLGLELGMDLNWRELRSAAFYRAVVAEFVGTLCVPCGVHSSSSYACAYACAISAASSFSSSLRPSCTAPTLRAAPSRCRSRRTLRSATWSTWWASTARLRSS